MKTTDYFEIAKTIVPFVAVTISIIALIISQKNTQKQIRVNKLEEILEITSTLESYYSTLFLLTSDLMKLELSEDKKENVPKYIDLNGRIESFFTHVSNDKLQSQFSRLYVLSHAYLPNNNSVKLKILAYSHLFDAIILSLLHKDVCFLNTDFSEGIPKPKKLSLFAGSIQTDIIEEMNLGFDRLPDAHLIEYFKEDFKKDCGIL